MQLVYHSQMNAVSQNMLRFPFQPANHPSGKAVCAHQVIFCQNAIFFFGDGIGKCPNSSSSFGSTKAGKKSCPLILIPQKALFYIIAPTKWVRQLAPLDSGKVVVQFLRQFANLIMIDFHH